MAMTRVRVGMRRHDEQTVDARAHGAQGGCRLDGISVRARHEQVQAPGAGGQVYAADELREILAVQASGVNCTVGTTPVLPLGPSDRPRRSRRLAQPRRGRLVRRLRERDVPAPRRAATCRMACRPC
jgi:hypothetical protein